MISFTDRQSVYAAVLPEREEESRPSVKRLPLVDEGFLEERNKRKTLACRLMLSILGREKAEDFPFAFREDEYLPGVRRMIAYLKETGILREERGYFEAGENFLPVIQEGDALLPSFNLTSEKKELLRRIAEKKENPLLLLQDELLSPEVLNAGSLEAKTFLQELREKGDRFHRVAVLDLRREESWELFRRYFPDVHFISSDGSLIREEDSASFDLVVALNTLHAKESPVETLRFAEALLRPSGEFHALEYGEADPFSVLISSLLSAEDPFRSEEEWAEMLRTIPFGEAGIRSGKSSGLLFLEAKASKEEKADIFPRLRRRGESLLSAYMVPGQFFLMTRKPLSTNGKVNRAELLRQAERLLERDTEAAEEGEELTETEKALKDIWRELLPVSSLKKDVNFFEAGGDSLLATKLLVRLREELGAELTLVEILEQNTLGRMAALIEEKALTEEDFLEGEI